MPSQNDVRKLALSLEGVAEVDGRFAFEVPAAKKKRAICWVWLERTDPKAARIPNPRVLAVSVADEHEKFALCESDPDVFFTEAHYNGYPAVLVRLDKIRAKDLRELIVDAHTRVLQYVPRGAAASGTAAAGRGRPRKAAAPAARSAGSAPPPRESAPRRQPRRASS